MYIFAYTIRCYGNRQSLESRRRERLAMSYESAHDAHEKNAAEGKTQKNPIGNLEKMTWDKEGLQKEVENYESGTFINWSELARRYKITNTAGELAKNGGQIAQECLKAEGVDLSWFVKEAARSDGKPIIRKRLKKGAGVEISIPLPETNEKLKQKLKTQVISGEYNTGELVVPRKVGMHI